MKVQKNSRKKKDNKTAKHFNCPKTEITTAGREGELELYICWRLKRIIMREGKFRRKNGKLIV